MVGGIAIVFDATPELEAMLRDGLGGRTGGEAYFVNRQGRILASTQPSRPVGASLEMPNDVRTLTKGASQASIVEHDGHYAIMACTVSSGYREFKTSDGYTDDVLAVVFTRLGEVRESSGALNPSQLTLEHALPPGASGGLEFATFCVGPALYAIPAAAVVEALPATGLAAHRSDDGTGRIGILVPQKSNGLSHFVWVFDLAPLLGLASRAVDDSRQIVIVRAGHHTIGLLVDELHGVPEFAATQIMDSPFGLPQSGLVSKFVRAGESVLIQVIDVQRLLERTLPDRPQHVRANEQETVFA